QPAPITRTATKAVASGAARRKKRANLEPISSCLRWSLTDRSLASRGRVDRAGGNGTATGGSASASLHVGGARGTREPGLDGTGVGLEPLDAGEGGDQL